MLRSKFIIVQIKFLCLSLFSKLFLWLCHKFWTYISKSWICNCSSTWYLKGRKFWQSNFIKFWPSNFIKFFTVQNYNCFHLYSCNTMNIEILKHNVWAIKLWSHPLAVKIECRLAFERVGILKNVFKTTDL